MSEKFDVVIGLEVHAQLATESKIFCNCSTRYGGDPNTHTCPICLGLPGTLPVLNQKVVEYAIAAGLALNCEIVPQCVFHRKNYFYPDLPKGYQISQFDYPICKNGYLDLEDEAGQNFRVRINRIHMEEDAGKLTHGSGSNVIHSDATLIDFNRAGVPLIEIVSEPDIKNPTRARIYLTTLKSILQYLEISDCNMEEGSLRVDANISLKPVGSGILGTRIELKNMNSFKSLEKALEYEVTRQTEILQKGGLINVETRTWDEKSGQTITLRGKEEAMDYRYFPEPDLVSIKISPEKVEEIRKSMGELPGEKKARFISQYNLPEYDAQVLTLDKKLADFFESAVREYPDSKTVSNWIMGDLLCLAKAENLDYTGLKITGKQLGGMLKLIDQGVISGKIAKTVLEEMFKSGKNPEVVVEERGLLQISDEKCLESIVQKVIKANPKAISDYYSGKERAKKFLIGQVMKETNGKANPQLAQEILHKLLQ